MKILLTGATGFIGSHIAEEYLRQGHQIFALKKKSSNLWRCDDFKAKIHWINSDNLEEIAPLITEINPEILVHCAWNGVKASERDNWIEQEKNLTFLVSLLELIKSNSVRKIIALGSQAEYGNFEGAIDENHPCTPNSAYGASKVCASIIIQSFSEINKIEWYWLRVFSVFGPREGKNWLIPATINSLLENKTMELSPCEQKYDYLFIKDFARGLLSIINTPSDKSGIYNLSSGESHKLEILLTYIEKKIAPDKDLLKIGCIPYRPNQVMHMQGISDAFNKQFGYKQIHNIYDGLDETINYYKNCKNIDYFCTTHF